MKIFSSSCHSCNERLSNCNNLIKCINVQCCFRPYQQFNRIRSRFIFEKLTDTIFTPYQLSLKPTLAFGAGSPSNEIGDVNGGRPVTLAFARGVLLTRLSAARGLDSFRMRAQLTELKLRTLKLVRCLWQGRSHVSKIWGVDFYRATLCVARSL